MVALYDARRPRVRHRGLEQRAPERPWAEPCVNDSFLGTHGLGLYGCGVDGVADAWTGHGRTAAVGGRRAVPLRTVIDYRR